MYDFSVLVNAYLIAFHIIKRYNLHRKKNVMIKVSPILFLCIMALFYASMAVPTERSEKINTDLHTKDKLVACTRSYEKLLWDNRIWPEVNKAKKLSFEEIITDEMIVERVEDTARKVNALSNYWNSPVTCNQLQAEMKRIARNTKQPAFLKKIVQSVHNEPRIIANCIVMPILTERLIRNWYAYDERVHGTLKARINAELLRYHSSSEMKFMSGHYSEMKVIKSSTVQDRKNYKNTEDPGQVVLNEIEWDEYAKSLPQQKNPINGTWLLQEDVDNFFIQVLLSQDSDTMQVATVSWMKAPFEQWWDKIKMNFPARVDTTCSSFTLPEIQDHVCEADTWEPTGGLPDARYSHVVVWTGTEMIVWGGMIQTFYLQSGGKYYPATDSWTPMTIINAPKERVQARAVWTGTEMIIWGGRYSTNGLLNDGARYNPINNTWSTISSGNAPVARSRHSAVWSGTEMIIWGGTGISNNYENSGGRYDPGNNSWLTTSLNNPPETRAGHSAIWSGTEMIIWGGCNQTQCFETGSRYIPGSDTWIPISAIGPPEARQAHSAVWTGSLMIVWGGIANQELKTGSVYDPAAETWTSIILDGAPRERTNHTAVWTGTEMIIWGGSKYEPASSGNVYFNNGAKYNPATNFWQEITVSNAPSGRSLHTAVWNESEMIVWGGFAQGNSLDIAFHSGGRYNPETDSWIPTSNELVPAERIHHTAVWTGTEMIVWGGWNNYGTKYLNTGGLYYPVYNTWISISTANAPAGREYPTAVWTGNEMIVWGGRNASGELNTGGKYNPTTNTWILTTIANAPTQRKYHTAVWTGNEMIIWGGDSNTGARYYPLYDWWFETTLTDAPESRSGHSAIWTGNEMIIWGGYGLGALMSGGKYDPSNDSWTPTSYSGAPSGRGDHTAVWTGTKMIIWGGHFSGVYNSGALYEPGSDTWTPTSLTGAPTARFYHTAIWNEDAMVVWGGLGATAAGLQTGGKFNPESNSWTAISLAGAPLPRYQHTAVSTGEEMIVWGGHSGGENYMTDSGGAYCTFLCSQPTEITNNSAYDNDECLDTGVLISWNTDPGNWEDKSLGLRTYAILRDGIQLVSNIPYGTTTYLDTTGTNGIYYTYSVLYVNGCGSSSATSPGTIAVDHVCTLTVHKPGINDSGTASPNGIIETDEPVTLVGILSNTGTLQAALVVGELSTSEPITLNNSMAYYPDIMPGFTRQCDSCYIITAPGLNRPSPHWDFSVTETVYCLECTPASGDFIYHVGSSFIDVPWTHFFYSYIEKIFHASIVSGCDAQHYCPSAPLQRQHMSKYLCAAMNAVSPNSCYLGACTGIFSDVPPGNPFCPYVEAIYLEGIASGCSIVPPLFCPTNLTTRQAMAKFVCNAMNNVNPGDCLLTGCSGVFADVPPSNPFCAYIESLYKAGVVSGCSASMYCPANPVPRDQMAKFTVNAFSLDW